MEDNMEDRGIAEIMMETGNDPIEWRGLTVHSGYTFRPEGFPSLFELRFLRFSTEHRQAMQIRIFGGSLDFGDGVADTNVILWADDWPETVTAAITWKKKGVKKKGDRRLVAQNSWRFDEDDEYELMGVGSAGALVTHQEDGWVRLECSDGTHLSDADFSDLMVEMRVS